MKFTRKGFFQSIFGGLFAAAAIPSVLKAEDNSKSLEDLALGKNPLTINNHGNIGIGYSDNVELGTMTKLHVSSIIFHVKNRRLEMSGDENGDFRIQWLDVKDDESSASITIQPPKSNPFKVSYNDIR